MQPRPEPSEWRASCSLTPGPCRVFHLSASVSRLSCPPSQNAEVLPPHAGYQPPTIPEWNEERALAALDIQRIPFEDLDGNTQGHAKRGRKIAVSPIAALPVKTLFHEAGHVMLGHIDEGDLADTERTPRDIREMEAEAVSLLCYESLGLPGAEYSRGYVQS